MKPGDTLICRDDFYNTLLRKTSFLKGKPYKIYDIDEVNGFIWITNEDGDNDYFSTIDNTYKNYIEWFYSEKELRQLKLESL